jgi:excinuclease UvrABC ATPase subunit
MLPLKLTGARTHNLKGVDLELAPGEVVVLTGVSGAGMVLSRHACPTICGRVTPPNTGW